MRSGIGVVHATVLCLLIVGIGACTERSPTQPEHTVQLARAVVFPGGCCYYQDRVVRTVVPPAANPRRGRDNFYGFPNGAAEGQKGVVAVAPGDRDYHGGHWKFHAVTFNVDPYLLTSEDAVLAAASNGDVNVVRVPEEDFKCPIQP